MKAELGRATAAEESLHAKLNSRDKRIAHLEQQDHGERRGRVGAEELDAIREQLGALRTAMPPGEQQLVDTLEKVCDIRREKGACYSVYGEIQKWLPNLFIVIPYMVRHL